MTRIDEVPRFPPWVELRLELVQSLEAIELVEMLIEELHRPFRQGRLLRLTDTGKGRETQVEPLIAFRPKVQRRTDKQELHRPVLHFAPSAHQSNLFM